MLAIAEARRQPGSCRRCPRKASQRRIPPNILLLATLTIFSLRPHEEAYAWILLPQKTNHHSRQRQHRRATNDCLILQQQHNKETTENSKSPDDPGTTSGSIFSINNATSRRRTLLQQAAILLTISWSGTCAAANALEEQSASKLFTRKTDQFAYEFQPPPNFAEPSQKPLKTHLDEVIIKASDRSGYQFGITVDPVRINSLTEFGTPEEVAAKVVLAEVNRDGVFDVKLMQDPVSKQDDKSNDTTFYQLNYLSSGKRGDKRFVAKFYIQNQKLYALTAQCKEADYGALEPEMLAAVASFRVL